MRRLLATVWLLLAPVGAAAQSDIPILVVDQERLFAESSIGRRVMEELESRSAELAAENRAIEAELIAEESELTELRQELAPEEFRRLADAFDIKVQRLREEQDAKTRALVELRDRERQSFSQEVGPILLEFMRNAGADVMLDRRSLLATSDQIDVTDEVIAEIDRRAEQDAAAPRSADSEAGPAPVPD